MLPRLPDWDGLHAFVAHFPIALLLVAPVFVLLGLGPGERAAAHRRAAALLMLLGTLGACGAALSGQEAAERAASPQAVWPVLERHEELAEVSCALFAILTALYGAPLIAPRRLRRTPTRPLVVTAQVAFLLLYAAACLVLLHAGHEGGRLVYEFGLRAAARGAG